MKKTLLALAVVGLTAYAQGISAENSAFRSIKLMADDESSILVNMESDMTMSFDTDSIVLSTPEYDVRFSYNDYSRWAFSTEWSKLSFKPGPAYEAEGTGSADDPYNALMLNTLELTAEPDTAWLTGYIVGSFTGTTITDGANFSAKNHVGGNILIAPAADVTNPEYCVAVQMKSSNALRPELNLIKNPGNLGKEVAIRGIVSNVGGKNGLVDPDIYLWGNKGKDPDPIVPEPPTAIDGINADNSNVSLAGNTLTLQNLPDNSVVTIVNVNGAIVASYNAHGSATIDLGELNHGIYIVSVNGKSLKISVTR